MIPYTILTNRKRALIALIHTVAFLAVAVATGMLVIRPLGAASPKSAWIMTGAYVLISGALLVLTGISRPVSERVYFGCCTTSASFGLLRQIFGDAQLPSAVYVRVAMLLCAVLVGYLILRKHETKPRLFAADERS